MSNYTTEILRLKGFTVKKVINKGNDTYVYVEKKKTEVQTCSRCGGKTKRVHDYLKERKIKHCKFGEQTIYLVYKPRRYKCRCGKNIIEKTDEIIPRYKMTKTLINEILRKTSKIQSFKSIAEELGISITTVMRIFDQVSYLVNQIEKIICIDEFKGNLGKFKYQAVTVNPETGKILIYIKIDINMV